MNYLEAFLKEKTRAENPHAATDKTPSVSFHSESPPRSRTRFSAPEPHSDRQRWPDRPHSPMSLRRCGALTCRTCHAHSPSPHRKNCALARYDACRSRWFWLSPHGAIKCVACASPANLSSVEAWVLARETGEGDDCWRIPGEILSLLRITSHRNDRLYSALDRVEKQKNIFHQREPNGLTSPFELSGPIASKFACRSAFSRRASASRAAAAAMVPQVNWMSDD